ncbi:PKHD-type hydroxylase [Polaromonas sp.]|uniref:PKHD-type hydroxylase n=1 Tax=Polaromonas sp. TaxID=1869339 RepID=UPI0025DEBDF9|nr:PKHD-type hydroxylase [Polaromonas sp.]
MLLRIPQVLQSDEPAPVRQLALAADRADVRSTAGSRSGAVKYNRQWSENMPAALQARQLVFATPAQPDVCYWRLARVGLPAVVQPLRGQPAIILSITSTMPYEPMRPRRAMCAPTFPASIFFSKPNSCDSGELALQDTYGEQRIEFDAGDLVMYPGTSVHGVEPVTRGARLACFFGSKAGFASTRSADCRMRLIW